jgi:hypothetical protein
VELLTKRKRQQIDDIADVHVVRWAVVTVAKRYGDGSYEAMLLATPKQLMHMLNIDDLALAERVAKLLLQNERSRTLD